MKSSRIINERHIVATTLILLSVAFFLFERSSILEGFWPGYWIGLALLVKYLHVFFLNNRNVVLTSFYIIFYYAGMLASGLVVSHGIVMIEIDQIGTANGTFWIVMLFLVVGIEATAMGFGFGRKFCLGLDSRRLPIGINWSISTLFITACLILSLYVMVLTGGPVFGGINRVTFWQSVAPPGSTILPSLVAQSFFFVSYYFLLNRTKTSRSIVPYLVLLAFLLIGIFVLGQKFSLFILFLNIWLLVLAGIMPNAPIKKRYLYLIPILLGALIIYTVFVYAQDDRSAYFVILRIALQSQILWSVLDDASGLSILSTDYHCYFGCNGSVDGREYISKLYLPFDVYAHYKNTGSNLSGFLPALSIKTMGLIPALVFHSTASFFMGFIQIKIVNSLKQKQVIYAFLLFKVQISMNLIFVGGILDAFRGMLLSILAITFYQIASIQTIRGFQKRQAL